MEAIVTLTAAHRALFANEQLSPTWRGEAAYFLGRAILQHDPTRRAEVDALSRQAIAEYAKAQSDIDRKPSPRSRPGEARSVSRPWRAHDGRRILRRAP